MKLFSAVTVLSLAASASAFGGVVVPSPSFAFRGSALSMSSIPQAARARAPGPGPAVGAPAPGVSGRGGGMRSASSKEVFANSTPVKVQGGSLRTFSFSSPVVEAVSVSMRTEGRPLNANVDLWQGPDNTPQKMGVYVEDARLRPFNAVIATPRGQNTVAIRNTAQMEFPLDAAVLPSPVQNADIQELAESTAPVTIQGGALKTYSFAPSVSSVQILLSTDGRPLNARIELLQGPNNNKQVVELYTEDGMERPFFAIVETPGTGNVVRVVNTAPLEFPMSARVEPYLVEPGQDEGVVIDGGNTRANERGLGGLPL